MSFLGLKLTSISASNRHRSYLCNAHLVIKVTALVRGTLVRIWTADERRLRKDILPI